MERWREDARGGGTAGTDHDIVLGFPGADGGLLLHLEELLGRLLRRLHHRLRGRLHRHGVLRLIAAVLVHLRRRRRTRTCGREHHERQ